MHLCKWCFSGCVAKICFCYTQCEVDATDLHIVLFVAKWFLLCFVLHFYLCACVSRRYNAYRIERSLHSLSPKAVLSKLHLLMCLFCIKGILLGIVCQLCDMPSKTLS